MKKKITIILLLLNSIIAISQETKYINANKLNIRNGAGKNFEIVTKASKNEKVSVISENGSWTEIETENGAKGFVSTKFLSNSIIENNDKKIGDYPITLIIVGIILIFTVLRIKKSPSSRSSSTKNATKKIINKPKQTIVKAKVTEIIQKEINEKEKVFCKKLR